MPTDALACSNADVHEPNVPLVLSQFSNNAVGLQSYHTILSVSVLWCSSFVFKKKLTIKQCYARSSSFILCYESPEIASMWGENMYICNYVPHPEEIDNMI